MYGPGAAVGLDLYYNVLGSMLPICERQKYWIMCFEIKIIPTGADPGIFERGGGAARNF